MICIRLQCIQKTFHMVSICRGMMTRHGQRHENASVLLIEFSCFYRWKIIWLIFVGVNRKIPLSPQPSAVCHRGFCPESHDTILQYLAAICCQLEFCTQHFRCPSAHYHTSKKDFKVFIHGADMLINLKIQCYRGFFCIDL